VVGSRDSGGGEESFDEDIGIEGLGADVLQGFEQGEPFEGGDLGITDEGGGEVDHDLVDEVFALEGFEDGGAAFDEEVGDAELGEFLEDGGEVEAAVAGGGDGMEAAFTVVEGIDFLPLLVDGVPEGEDFEGELSGGADELGVERDAEAGI